MEKEKTNDHACGVEIQSGRVYMYVCIYINSKQCKFVLSHFGGEKNLHGKNKYGGQGLANSGNISLKFEVNSTLLLPVKFPLTKPEES